MYYAIAFIAIFLLLIIVTVRRETRKIEVSFHTLPLAGLPGALEGFKIAHITDIHYPFHLEKKELEKIVETVNGEKPDLLLLTGDIISTRKAHRMECPEVLGSIEATYGRFAVMGNHDYCYGRKELRDRLREWGITVLRNERLPAGPEGGQIQILGLDDPSTFRDEPEMLFHDIPGGGLRIVISHAPGGIRHLLKEQVHLILTGHTHGGQIRLPLVGALYMPVKSMREYDAGWFRRGETWIYVNRGLGFAMFPLRFLCPREVAIITLTSRGEDVTTKRRPIS